jgi:hypothetical protein
VTGDLIQRTAERLIWHACQRLPGDVRDQRYLEWTAEIPAILRDPDVRSSIGRTVRALRFAAGTHRGAPPSGTRWARQALNTAVVLGALFYLSTNLTWRIDGICGAGFIVWLVSGRFKRVSDLNRLLLCCVAITALSCVGGFYWSSFGVTLGVVSTRKPGPRAKPPARRIASTADH